MSEKEEEEIIIDFCVHLKLKWSELGMGDPTLKSEFRDRHFTQPPLAHLGRFYILGFAYDCKLPPRNAKKLNRTCAAPWSPVVSQHWQLTLLVFVQF